MNPETLSPRQIARIMDDAEQDIVDIRVQAKASTSRLEKNLFYSQIDNRQAIIKKLKSLQNGASARNSHADQGGSAVQLQRDDGKKESVFDHLRSASTKSALAVHPIVK